MIPANNSRDEMLVYADWLLDQNRSCEANMVRSRLTPKRGIGIGGGTSGGVGGGGGAGAGVGGIGDIGIGGVGGGTAGGVGSSIVGGAVGGG